MRILKYAMAGLFAGCLLSSGISSASETKPDAAEQSPGVDVLVLSERMKIDPQLAEQFAGENVKFVVRKISDPLSEEMLRKFHVVLIADWDGPRTKWFFPPSHVEAALTTDRNVKLLQEYVKSGGALFFTPIYGDQISAEALTEFLKPYGACLISAQVRDDAHAFTNLKKEGNETIFSEGYYDYAWTTAVTPHPATRGVERLFYPAGELRWDDMYSTPVVALKNPAWTVLVKGMGTSRPSKGVDYNNWHTIGDKPPVIAAVRTFGDGRVALFTPSFHYTLSSPFSIPKKGWIGEAHTGKIDAILLDKGDGEHPSHGRKLMLNMLRWLAEPARAKGMGGYDEKAFAELATPVPAPAWLGAWKPDDGNRWFKLLVGARSSFSDGKGTIAEYAKAAKAAGVSVLFMTESFERFDPSKWQEYRSACAKASDDSLKVVPGLEIPDAYGNRYLLLGSPVFPAPNLLTPDGKALEKPQYLCLCFPKAITVLHRATTSQVPHELHKQFQGVSVFTYRNAALEDNSLPAYEWQVFRFSNPLPFVVHETYSPDDLPAEAATGQQMYGSADNLADLNWYLGEHGTAHFWESPVRLQISAGPIITELGGSTPDQNAPSVKGAIQFTIQSDEPIKEVTLWENFNLYRRWTPNTKEFTVKNVKLPEGHANWMLLKAIDAKGRMVVSPGMAFGKQVAQTWRCADRQNWWSFPNIYTGTDISQFDLRVPSSDGTLEGSSLFPEMKGPQRGDNLAALLDFSLACPGAYVQDVSVDQRYTRALWSDAAYDAKPSNATVRSRVFEAKIRYYLYWPEKPQSKTAYLPFLKEVTISLRKPTEPSGDVFPVFTTLDAKNAQVRGDMSYSYIDQATGKEVSGKLEKGFIDLPKGGHVGGFIALSDGIRVSAKGLVGFAPPAWNNGALPIGSTWHASFVTVQPAEVDRWLNLMGLRGEMPFSLKLKRGKLANLAFSAACEADNYGIEASIDKALDPKFIESLSMGLVNLNKEGLDKPLSEYRLPVTVAGVCYNWPAAVVSNGAMADEIPVFEGKAYARIDTTKTGNYYLGNVILSDSTNLHIGILRWSKDACEVEVNNPTRNDITASIWTCPEAREMFQGRAKATFKAGSSLLLKLTEEAR